MLQTMCILELKRESYAHLKQTGHRWKLSLKLASWIWNGFWPFKTHRNARKLLEEAKFESPYLFQAKGTYFKHENIEFLHEQWVSSKFIVNFELTLLILNWSNFLPLMSEFWTLPNFKLSHWWSSLSPKTCWNKFQMSPFNSKYIVLI